jgi:AcrR family transcriptional regulator
MSDVKMDKRPYHSPLRQEQAQATRQRILDAALDLFATTGYSVTSIAAIAREAGVVPETIYAAFGSKRGIVDALIERATPEDVTEGIRHAWDAAGSPAQQLRTLAHGARSFWERNGELALAMRRGTGDAEIGGIWGERSDARRELVGGLLGTWPGRVLKRTVTPIEAADITWSIASDESFHALVGDRGWTADRWEAWVGDTLVTLLLKDGVQGVAPATGRQKAVTGASSRTARNPPTDRKPARS